MRFGKASPPGLADNAWAGASVHAVADPFGGNSGNNNRWHAAVRRSDDQVCLRWPSARRSVGTAGRRRAAPARRPWCGIVSILQQHP